MLNKKLYICSKTSLVTKNNYSSSFTFLITFFALFGVFYGFHLVYIGLTTPGGLYNAFLDQHLNYIKAWRLFCISSTAKILHAIGYTVYITGTTLKVSGHSGFKLVYSCLGYGVMSFFAAFVIAFPKSMYSRIVFLFTGLITIQVLNTVRFTLIALYYNPKVIPFNIDHHDLFNFLLYVILCMIIYLWINGTHKPHSKNYYTKGLFLKYNSTKN